MVAVRTWRMLLALPICLLLALPICLLAAVSVDAQITVEGPAGDAMIPRLQQWADEDVMPTGHGVIQIVPENCMQMEAEACTYWTSAPRFVMYFPDLAYLWTEPGHTDAERESTWLNFYHELGHVLDFSLDRHGYRLKWFAIMHDTRPHSAREARELVNGRNPRLWFSTVNTQNAAVVPDEQFAQAYDYCAQGMSYADAHATIRDTYWGFSYDPSRRQYQEACQLIRGL
ncbi:MAG TPA: hypothetical protein VLZ06_06605 [Solirubrobacteraceae bacterium]|nr:hypothetical protein [Solirubrobacteraceae bacterium]